MLLVKMNMVIFNDLVNCKYYLLIILCSILKTTALSHKLLEEVNLIIDTRIQFIIHNFKESKRF